ncbi:uncharacterized protein [Elaeis guineensis]|uniref:uncharacterized protein isoform X3 n=1 Tax=Elaeis guineensis var. tenera TaxID=51953 RepID=UPI003C6D7745
METMLLHLVVFLFKKSDRTPRACRAITMAPARDRLTFASSLLALLILRLLATDAAAGLALGAQAIVLQLLFSYVSSAGPDRLRRQQLQSPPAGACMVLQDELLSNRYVSSKFLVRTQITKTFVFRMLEGDLHLFSVSSYCK